MAVETTTEVEGLASVEDDQGDRQPPANATEQQRIAESLGNFNGLQQLEVVTEEADTGEALPSHDVPDGVKVLVEYREPNSGNVYVGDETQQKSALAGIGDFRSFPVTNTDRIYIRTPSAGDGVIVTFEVTE